MDDLEIAVRDRRNGFGKYLDTIKKDSENYDPIAFGIDAEEMYGIARRIDDLFPNLRQELRENGSRMIYFNGKEEFSDAVMIFDDDVTDSLTFLTNRGYNELGSVLGRAMITETDDYKVYVISSELAKGSGVENETEAVYDLFIKIVKKNPSEGEEPEWDGIREFYGMEDRAEVTKFLNEMTDCIKTYLSTSKDPNKEELNGKIVEFESDPNHNLYFHNKRNGKSIKDLPDAGQRIEQAIYDLFKTKGNIREKLNTAKEWFRQNGLFESEYRTELEPVR